MIKQYTFTPIAKHDADYKDYRPNHIPAGTCGYPYDMVYPTAYPTHTIVTCKKKKHKKHHNREQNEYKNEKNCPFMLVAKITILVLILMLIINYLR